jgi:hypothetical protein
MIEEIKRLGPGNQRTLDISLKKGRIVFNVTENKLGLEIEDSAYEASEIGRSGQALIDLPGTNLQIITRQIGDKKYNIEISREYDDSIQLQFNGLVENNEITAAENPYRFIVENKGRETPGEHVRINIYSVS